MVQTLSEDDVKRYDEKLLKDTDEWWLNLSLPEKKIIWEYHRSLFLQRKCCHEFTKINHYSFVSSKKPYSDKIDHCNKCGYTRTVQDSRDEKLKSII